MTFLVGIAGGSCSGKTTFARGLVAPLRDLGVTSISFDSYYRPLGHLTKEQRDRVNFDHPDSLDDALFVDHLRQLRAGRSVEQPVYDFSTHTRLPDPVPLHPNPVVLVDGILLLAFPAVAALFDLSLFIHAPADERLSRRIARDTTERGRTRESVLRQFAETVAPMHDRFVEPSAARASRRVAWGIELDGEIAALSAELRERLG